MDAFLGSGSVPLQKHRILEVSYTLPPSPIYFWALGGWWVGGSLIIYFQWRGLSAQNAQLCAQNAELRWVLIGGIGSHN